MIVGAQGIPLSYVTRDTYSLDQKERDTWEEKEVLSVPLTGRLQDQDNLTSHNIILSNIADTSDVFNYVKPYIKKDDGRAYIKEQRSRYEKVEMQEQYVSEANSTIETIQYINERAMTFEKFVIKLVKAVDEIENMQEHLKTLTLLRSPGRGSATLN